MKLIEIKNRYTGEVIFSHECENNTMKITVELAVKSNANLRNANLRNAKKIPMYCKWTHGITNGNLIHIGCEKRSIEEWDLFFNSDKKLTTERNTTEFKQIEAVYLAYKAYLTHLKS
jgi:hypothetical protein